MTRFMGDNVKVFADGVLVGEMQSLTMKEEKPIHPGCGQPWIDHQDLRWESDWDGDEVGHPEHKVVGLWRWRDTEVYLYVDAETLEILSIWENVEE